MNALINKDSYNKIAVELAQSRDTSFVSKLVTEFADKVKPDGKILDIGCGTGYPLASYLADNGYQVTGIDTSEKMIELALARNINNATFLLTDFFDFKTNDKFDGILAWDSFFHFPKEKQDLIYARVAELLNPGGYLLFTHGNEEGEITEEMMGEPFLLQFFV